MELVFEFGTAKHPIDMERIKLSVSSAGPGMYNGGISVKLVMLSWIVLNIRLVNGFAADFVSSSSVMACTSGEGECVGSGVSVLGGGACLPALGMIQ
jgi:uncharacterized protein YqgC (DUF456 family)